MKIEQMKILVVDDSETARLSLERLLKENQFNQITCFANPAEALKALESTTFDVAIVDIVMPEMNGYDFVKAMKLKLPDISAIVVSSLYTKEDKVKTMKAYEVGAIAILEKPIGFSEKDKILGKELMQILKQVHAQMELPKLESPIKHAPKEQTYKIIGIGASLGGPAVLQIILKELPINFPVPIVIVQHLASSFDEELVKWLNGISKNKVKLAQNNITLSPGEVYIAPNNAHLKVAKGGVLSLSDEPPVNGLKPSIDIFFNSLVESYNKESIAMLLTGMGSDGALGMLALKKAGAYTIAQHQNGCEMYGMPQAAINADAATAVIPLQDLAKELTLLMK